MNIVNAELRKLITVRSTWVYAIIILLGVAGGDVLSAKLYGFDTAFTADALTAAADLAMLVMIFAVANTVGADMSKGTQAWTFLHTTRRTGVVTASTLLTTIFYMLAGIVGMLLGWLGITMFGGHVDLSSMTPIYGSLARWAVFSLLAGLLAYILRSGTFAAMLLLADVFVLEVMLGAVQVDWLKPVQAILPLANASILASGSFPGYDHGRGAAAVILAGLIGVVFFAASRIVARRAVK